MFNMTSQETYAFILCLIVYVALTLLFTVMILYILRLTVKLIRNGAEDDNLLKMREKLRKQKVNPKKKKTVHYFDYAFTAVVCFVMFFAFGMAMHLQLSADNVTGDVPTYRVVLSDSMSKKYDKNTYLFKNDLNDQFCRFDLILTHKLPEEKDLKLYDIVVYEVDDTLVIHRIVSIEEPNEAHPNERYFRLQGDNVHVADKYPVKYSQMKAIYKGEKIENVGSFVTFLQSPAGYMCILLVFLGIIFIPIMEHKIEKEQKIRLRILLRNDRISYKNTALCVHGRAHSECPACNKNLR